MTFSPVPPEGTSTPEPLNVNDWIDPEMTLKELGELGAPSPSSVPVEEPTPETQYAPLAFNVESCINQLIIYVEDGWPQHYREGALRSLRSAIRDEYAASRSPSPPVEDIPIAKMPEDISGSFEYQTIDKINEIIDRLNSLTERTR